MNSSFPSSHWWNPECSQAKRGKNRALTRYKNNRGCLQLWIEYKKKKAIFRQAVLNARRESWAEFVSSISKNTTSTQVWKKIKLLKNKPKGRTIVLREGGDIVSSSSDISNILGEHFSVAGSSNPALLTHKQASENNSLHFGSCNESWYNKPFSMKELASALSSCCSKAPGFDNINYEMLKHLDQCHLNSLLAFYNYLFKSDFPEQWKQAVVVPILKPNKPAHAKSSYRPIALLSCLGKLFEKMVNRRLLAYIERYGLFAPFQSGFRTGHSTYDALCRLENDARMAVLSWRYCLAVFLDISKAFDNVWHHGLLVKLGALGLSGQLYSFIRSFLSRRSIRVRVGGELSDVYDISFGVPQGSFLGPTLFSIMINDIFDSIPESVKCSLYADDGAMWVSSSNYADAHSSIQAALDGVTSGVWMSLLQSLHQSHLPYVDTIWCFLLD